MRLDLEIRRDKLLFLFRNRNPKAGTDFKDTNVFLMHENAEKYADKEREDHESFVAPEDVDVLADFHYAVQCQKRYLGQMLTRNYRMKTAYILNF